MNCGSSPCNNVLRTLPTVWCILSHTALACGFFALVQTSLIRQFCKRGVDVHSVINKWRVIIGRIDQEESSLGVLVEINIVKAVHSGFKFDNATGGCNNEDTPAILAIVSNRVFATQAEKREDICYAIAVEIYLRSAEIALSLIHI